MLKIAIIIPTHNRSHVLKRAIEYYSNFTQYEIIICDSSETKDSNDFKKLIYFHLPGYTFAQKLLYAVEHSNSEYICFSADDDFLIESSLHKGCDFLMQNPSFVSVHGYFSGFKISSDTPLYNIPIYPQNSDFQIMQEHPADRIFNSMNPYMHLLYSLHPKKVSLECLKFAVNFPEVTNVEISFNIITLIFGKHKTLNTYWMARDSSVYTNYTVEKNSLYSIINDYSIYLKTIVGQKFKKSFVEIFCKNSSVSEHDAIHVFDKIFENYFSYLNHLRLDKNINKIDILKNTKYQSIKSLIYNFLKKNIYYRFKYFKFYKTRKILLRYSDLS